MGAGVFVLLSTELIALRWPSAADGSRRGPTPLRRTDFLTRPSPRKPAQGNSATYFLRASCAAVACGAFSSPGFQFSLPSLNPTPGPYLSSPPWVSCRLLLILAFFLLTQRSADRVSAYSTSGCPRRRQKVVAQSRRERGGRICHAWPNANIAGESMTSESLYVGAMRRAKCGW